MRAVMLGLLLAAGCGPVLFRDESEREHERDMPGAQSSQAGAMESAGTPAVNASDAGPQPVVSVSVKPVECGKCFELQAVGAGGRAPYAFSWENGSFRADRYVCANASDLTLSVVAQDAAGALSVPQTIKLAALTDDAGCSEQMPPTAATPAPLLCIDNPSFEGTPVANFGQPGAFDAAPWSACTNPALGDTANMPAIVDETVGQGVVTTPKAADGTTYVALSEGQQVSQTLCSALDTSASFSVELDISRFDVPTGLAPEPTFLEIWGGIAADCSQRELLWASPALQLGWTRYCVTLHPHAFMDQLTLRGSSDMSSAALAYLFVDNLKPVERCP